MKSHYDVIILGSGTAGIAAAIQCGRLGLHTLLVEKNGMLGGTLTVAGVSAPGIFHAWGKQVIGGIGWELVEETVRLAGTEMPDFTLPGRPHWCYQVNLNGWLFACLADEKISAAGVEVLLHAMPAAIAYQDGHWQVRLCLKEGLQQTGATILIDSTGDANGAALAGLALEREEEKQPGTMMVKLGGYDIERLDFSQLQRAMVQAAAQGHLRAYDIGWGGDEAVRIFLSVKGRNANHIFPIDGSHSGGRTQADMMGRASVLRMYRFLKQQPGLENLRIEWMANECGIRESVRIVGKKRITGADYCSGKIWEDAVCYCFYPIDVHGSNGHGVDIRPLKEGTVPSIPRGAMLPAGSERMIVAGRAISGDREAHSAYRVQASCMAMGQAAGVMAALAVRDNMDVEALAMHKIRETLTSQGAIVPNGD